MDCKFAYGQLHQTLTIELVITFFRKRISHEASIRELDFPDCRAVDRMLANLGESLQTVACR